MSAGGIIDELKKIPPVTRFLCGATLAVTLPVNLQLVSPYSIVFVKEFVTQNLEVSSKLSHMLCSKSLTERPQIWRPFTSMFFAGARALAPSSGLILILPHTRQGPECHLYLSLSCSSEPNAT